MDTPERSKSSQITTSVRNFEDSPVFDFLNSLSPIKPVKPMHITQTINPLSFASLPSVFSSPHLAPLKESRFLRRHHLSDPSKPEFSFDDGNMADRSNLDVHVATKLDEQKENLDPRVSEFEKPSYECSKLVVEFAESLNCDSDMVNSNLSCLKAKHVSENACTSSASGEFVEEERNANTKEADLEGLGNLDQSNWDSLIHDASYMIGSDLPNIQSHSNSVDPATTFYRSIKNAIQNAQSLGAVVSGEREAENMPSQPGQGTEIAVKNDVMDDSSFSNSSQQIDYEGVSGIYRGMRRRCLVFEMAGARRKHMEDGSASDSPLLLSSDGNSSSIQQSKAENDSSRSIPGIGLHLNALSKGLKIGNHESSASGRLLIGPSSSTNFLPPNNTLANYSLERDIDTFGSGGLPAEDPRQESGYIANGDVNPSSSKKRRIKLDKARDGESCKRCNCKKSKCLKLYCECFAAGVYCVEPCACIDCFNKPIHEDTVLATRKQIESRNPLAFAPKVIKGSDSLPEIGDDFTNTPASARHKRGCNCKKSGCLKKYCECYQGGVGCSMNCRCEGCKNAFGRKDGSGTSATEPEYDEDEIDTTEKAAFDLAILERCMDSEAVGSARSRQSFSNKRPPRATLPSICSYSGSQAFEKPSLFRAPPKFSPCFETVKEDEMPHFLLGGGSPMSGIKSSSPNRKRVSPPQSLEAGMRSSRKLILQSIPSFPSLASNQ